MGVPSLFRWFQRTFPGVVRKPDKRGSTDECDNLYIDANSIVHNACHPNDRPAPATEEEMLVDIGLYLDHVIKTAKPTKLVFIAIDGVAPRAKISQQRARRFKAAKDAKEEAQKKRELIEMARKTGKMDFITPDTWDSNTITPGTPFMAKLDAWVHSWILRKFQMDPDFAQLVIIFSGSNVPGEGEHKAMEYIRRQRAQEGYKPLRHCFYGPDADLIMLALATHEPDFRIVREDPADTLQPICTICGEWAHTARACPRVAGGEVDLSESWVTVPTRETAPFRPPALIFFDVMLLRLALAPFLDHKTALPADQQDDNDKVDFERAIDDFIVLLTLLGNDFLPALPLPDWEIRKDAIKKVVQHWKVVRCVKKGYLTKNGTIYLDRLEALFKCLSDEEPWSDKQETKRLRGEVPYRPTPSASPEAVKIKKASETPVPGRAMSEASKAAASKLFNTGRPGQHAASLVGSSKRASALPDDFPELAETSKPALKREFDPDYDYDETKNGIDKDKYYTSKLGDRGNSLNVRRHMAEEYVKGLTWVLAYYHQGCPSWDWVYEYHYAPFPSDACDIRNLRLGWRSEDRGQPVRPFWQLMMVFPPASADHIPKPFSRFMTAPDSPILDFYPEVFKLDIDRNKPEWKAVVLLPFIDFKRLEMALGPVERDVQLWTEEEKARNRNGHVKICISEHHPLWRSLYAVERDPRLKQAERNLTDLVADSSDVRIAGIVRRDLEYADALERNARVNRAAGPYPTTALSLAYKPPTIPPGREHRSVVLDGQPKPRKYALMARLKRPENLKKNRQWEQADNAGRTAKNVADEFARWSETGQVAKDLLERFNILQVVEDGAEDAPETELPEDWDGFLFPIFPAERNIGLAAPAELGWEDEDDDVVLEEQEEGGGAASGARRMDTTTSASPQKPLVWGRETSVKAEPSDDEQDMDLDSDEERARKPKIKIKKAKTNFNVKSEPID